MDSETATAPRARIACISRDEKSLEALTVTFKTAGYEVAPPGSGAADLCLVDLRSQSVSAKKARSLAAVLRHRSAEASIFFLIDPSLTHRGRAALRRFGEVIPAAAGCEHLIERCRQMIRLRNIAEEAGERMKSLASLNRSVEFPPIATLDKPLKVLIAGAPGPAASACINAVRHIAEDYVCVLTAGQALRAMELQGFDAAVFLPSGENDPLFSLTRAMHRNKTIAGVPIIHIADKKAELPVLAKRGANEFMLHQHVSDDLGARIQLAARRYRLLRSMRVFLKACNGEGVRDNASGAFTSAFLAEHGARLCARADQTDRPLCATLVHLSPNHEYESAPGRKVLHQAARLMKRVTRAEDVTARIGPDTFLILSPATIESDARALALRIDGVLSNTVFRGGNDQTLYSVKVSTAICMRRPGEAIEEVVANAIKARRNAQSATPPRRQSPQ